MNNPGKRTPERKEIKILKKQLLTIFKNIVNFEMKFDISLNLSGKLDKLDNFILYYNKKFNSHANVEINLIFSFNFILMYSF